MEDTLLSQFKQILEVENVTDCVITDAQGLCLLASPNCSTETAGLVSAIAQYASKLDTNADCDPIISLEGNSMQCLIKNDRGISTAIFKNKIVDLSKN